MEGHRDLGGLCGLAVPRARRGGDETDRWGQAASEGAGRGLSGNASGWSRGSARIAVEEGERADRWGRPGSEGRRRARGAERAGLEQVGPRGLAGPSGMRGELGPRKRKRSRPNWAAWKGWAGRAWAAGLGLGSLLGFYFPFLFYF